MSKRPFPVVSLEITPSWWKRLAGNLTPMSPESVHRIFAQVAATALGLQPCKRLEIERTTLHVVVVPERGADLSALCEMADFIREQLELMDVSCLPPAIRLPTLETRPR